jgi:SAM-dependent methyltransferase
VTPRVQVPNDLVRALGVTVAEHPAGRYVPADPTGRTGVPGVWAAGNLADPMAQVVTAAAAGARTGAAVNADLVAEDTAAAVAHHDFFTRDFWYARYAAAGRIWSGNPNPHLVATAADLPPGTALDVGAGEGADALWLATRGWTVTGADVSAVALDKAAAHGRAAGVEITWERVDVRDWQPPCRYDLVSAQFLHLPRPMLILVHRRLAAAVRPGGTLLIVGHHPDDQHLPHAGHEDGAGVGQVRQVLRDMLFTAEDAAAALDPAEWEVSVQAPQRTVTGPDGSTVTRRDALLRAVRRR